MAVTTTVLREILWQMSYTLSRLLKAECLSNAFLDLILHCSFPILIDASLNIFITALMGATMPTKMIQLLSPGPKSLPQA